MIVWFELTQLYYGLPGMILHLTEFLNGLIHGFYQLIAERLGMLILVLLKNHLPLLHTLLTSKTQLKLV